MKEQKLKNVLNVLSQRGTYRQQPQLLTVADVDFQFDAVFRGPGDSEAMVVVVTGNEERVASIISKVRALSHTMLRSGSKRPLTLVMLVDQESSPLLEALSRICRVVAVTAANEDQVVAQLRSLLPLELPEPQESQPDASRQLRNQLGTVAESKFVNALLAAGRRSGKDVQEQLASAIEAAIKASEGESSEDA
ncbi:MAG TPA: hypothetical protein PKD64_15370 [Pirellulaceae bacterium]|nr:hypothetical protein [Pirellulaceae bacterium]HMO93565.1 hypothetical protein [Pirellulaceae bacterium]HMP71114.1 hypothetical protein [Pirellulaceae bacterium]